MRTTVMPEARGRSAGRRIASLVTVLALLSGAAACEDDGDGATTGPGGDEAPTPREIFRFETFGNETWWTDTLRMHEVIQSAVDPVTALSVGLKVDADALPPGILEGADLEDPATTVELLRLNAVVGLNAEVEDGSIRRVGVTCALCHSTVDDAVAPGIGSRLDGWPNLDLDPGAIVALSPFLQDPGIQEVLTSWGPGRFDPRWNQDGLNGPVQIPPAYGLEGVPLETYTGEGPVSYWNAYVAVTQMRGHGDFGDPRLGISVDWDEDLVTPLLSRLAEYQFGLEAPAPPAGSFDPAAALRGEALFQGEAGCADCHAGARFTDAGERLHSPSETCMDPGWASRSATGLYRTTPLRALWQHAPYFHDGSAPTLEAVVAHYDGCLDLGLSADERADLVEYLRSL